MIDLTENRDFTRGKNTIFFENDIGLHILHSIRIFNDRFDIDFLDGYDEIKHFLVFPTGDADKIQRNRKSFEIEDGNTCYKCGKKIFPLFDRRKGYELCEQCNEKPVRIFNKETIFDFVDGLPQHHLW